ncbi:ER membrane protein DP1/Yop1 [Phlyctochytrium bullatum]|nr:ER membrane protein DP1/Yop1 [Phlyctochytrium bullatum]
MADIQKLKETLIGHYKNADKALSSIKPLTELEQKTKIPKLHLLVYAALGLVYIILILANVGGSFLTHALGFFYPAIESIRAAETGTKDEYQQWLSYWIILGFLTFLEYTNWALLSVLPYYYALKVGLLIWLMLPQTKGAYKVYHVTLRRKPSPPAPTDAGKEKDKEKDKEQAPDASDKKPGPAPQKPARKWEYAPLSRVVR